MRRKFFYIPIFLVILLGVIPLFIDFSKYAAPYLVDAQKAIGRTIKTGSIRLQLLPTPRIKIYDVSFGNASGASKPEMITVKNVEVILSLFDLLIGKITVKSINLNTPEITLEKNKDGSTNWELHFTPPKNESTKSTSHSANPAAAAVIVNHFEANNATITYIDHKDGSTKTFSNLTIECDSEKLMGPYKIQIHAGTTENKIDIDVLTGDFSSRETSLVAGVTLSLQEHRVRAELKGSVDIEKKHLSGKLTASSVDYPLTLDLPYNKIDLHKPIDIQAEIHTTPENITIADLRASHPVGQIVGTARYNLSTQLCEVDLKFKHLEDSATFQCTTKNFNEFEYHISSSHYKEILKWFTKDSFIKNTIDIKGIFKTEGDFLIFKKTSLHLGDADAETNIQLNTVTKIINVTAQLQSLERWGKLWGHDLPISGPAAIILKLTPTKEHLEIHTKISLSKGLILFDGVLGTTELLTKGNLRLEHINLDGNIVNLRSDILVKKTEIDLNIENIELKNKSGIDLFAGGKLLIDLSRGKPHVAGSITAQPIQLTAYQNSSVHVSRALYMPETTVPQFLHVSNANSRWLSTPIILPLHAFTMNIHVNVPKITLSGLIFEALQSDISLKAGQLDIPFSAHMYGGKLSGSLVAQSSNGQNIGLSVKFDDISLEKIQAVAAHFSRGKASGSIDLKTQGKSQYDWVSKLKGKANFSVNDGIVKGFNLQEIINTLKKPSKLLDLTNLQSSFGGKAETAFSQAKSSFTIANGIASTNDLTIDATDAQLRAEGQADLLNWQIRLSGQVLAPTLKDVPPLQFIIKGPLDQPSYSLDLKQIQQLFLKKGAGDMVSKALGKSIPGIDQLIPGLSKKSKKPNAQASNSNNNQQEESIKPEKMVQGLLKGIFG